MMDKFQNFRKKFKRWRMSRPFWGATFSLLAGLIILYMPIHLLEVALRPGNFVVLGLLFGGLMTIIGILSYFYTRLNIIFGIITIFLSIASILGALGRLFVGTLLGIIGGSLLLSWRVVDQSVKEGDKDYTNYTLSEVAASSTEQKLQNE